MTRKLKRSPAAASDPGRLTLCDKKLKYLRPNLYGLKGWWHWLKCKFDKEDVDYVDYIRRQLDRGDSRAAVVIQLAPLMVAAYTDELDCVALLCCPDEMVEYYGLEIGTRLLTVNFYKTNENGQVSSDLVPGPGSKGYYHNFHPLIAEFLSNDFDRIESRKAEISEAEWERCYSMAFQKVNSLPVKARSGQPIFSWFTEDELRKLGMI